MNLREIICQLDASDPDGMLTLAADATEAGVKAIIYLWMHRLGGSGNMSALLATIDRRTREPALRGLLTTFADTSKQCDQRAAMALADAAGLPWEPGQRALFEAQQLDGVTVGDRVEATEHWGGYVQPGTKGTIVLNEDKVEFGILWDYHKHFQHGILGRFRNSFRVLSAVERLGGLA